MWKLFKQSMKTVARQQNSNLNKHLGGCLATVSMVSKLFSEVWLSSLARVAKQHVLVTMVAVVVKSIDKTTIYVLTVLQ